MSIMIYLQSMRHIKILETRSEIGAGTRGASLGIDALKVASWDFNSPYFSNYPIQIIPNKNKKLFNKIEYKYAKRILGVANVLEKVADATKNTIRDGVFPIVLAGDHSSAAGTIAGIKMAHPEKRIGAIWLDAHADLHTPYTSPSGNVHGMPLSVCLNEDNLVCKKNDPPKKIIEQWERMKNIGNIAPKLYAEDIVFIALRDYEKEEAYLINEHNMKVITVEEGRKMGMEQCAAETLAHLKNCDYIYLTYDVDCIDSSVSKGTGTPVPNGLFEDEIERLLLTFMQEQKLCCFEITEVNPTLDSENKMAEIAFQLLEKCTAALEGK